MTREAQALHRPDAEQLESYLAEVTARLPGPARAHAGIVAELRAVSATRSAPNSQPAPPAAQRSPCWRPARSSAYCGRPPPWPATSASAMPRPGNGPARHLVCLLGPPQDPAGVRGLGDLGEAFARIASSGASFEVNNIPELVYLTEVVLGAAGVSTESSYADHGLSKQDTMVRASSPGAYSLWGVTPFLEIAAARNLRLEPLVTSDPILQRIMVTVVVNPGKVAGVNASAADAFQCYLLSPATQSRIRAFRNTTLGRPMFFAAGRDNEDALLPGNAAGSGSRRRAGTGTSHGKHR